MGGEIAIDSAPGQGTTVSFEFAFTPAPAPASPKASAGASPVQLAPGHTVLLVEDDAVNRMVVERFLQTLDQHPLCAGDIQAALATVDRHRPDIALIDMNLPDGDGRELLARLRLARLRALPGVPQLPAVLMSAHVPANEVKALLDAGFAAFLPKPFTRAQLQALLARLLGDGAATAPEPDAGDAQATDARNAARLEWVSEDFLRTEHDALGDAVLGEIAAVFASQGDTLVSALLDAAHAGDAGECRRLAHKLRGAASNLGLEALRTQAGSLEQDLLNEAQHISLPERASALQQTYRETVRALRATLARLADDRR